MDYNIYIRSAVGGTASDPTSPWKGGEGATQSESSQAEAYQATQQAISAASNPDSLVSKGVGAVAKAAPWVAIAMAVVKAADQVMTTAMEFSVAETGDYAAKTDYENAKVAMRSVLAPFSATLGVIRGEQGIRIASQKAEMGRSLMGMSSNPYEGGAGV